MRLALFALGLLACAEAEAVVLPADAIVVDALPFISAGSTRSSASSIAARYACAPSIDQPGPEVFYRFSLDAPARVTAWVEGVVDVHILHSPEIVSGTAKSCAARGDLIAEAEMAAGEHWLAVDSGSTSGGDFVLHLDAIGDAWIERPVAQGVLWRGRRYVDRYGPQVVHELVIDTTVPGVEVRAFPADGCEVVAAVGEAAGAVAGINGGYFSLEGDCAPRSLIKSDGALVATNEITRGAFGFTSAGAPLVDAIPSGEDWPAAHQAHGGGPILVVAGVAHRGTATAEAEGFGEEFMGKHPRTFAGRDAQGLTHFVTVDGRRPNAAGLSVDELADFAASDIGLPDAVNLDGGGSSTMWIVGVTPNGVVNYPSDGVQEDPTHLGSRACSGGLFVFAPP